MFWLIFSIVLWGIFHSLAASLRFKEALRRAFGMDFMKFYRLIYNAFSVFSFVPILYLMRTLPDTELYQVPPPWNVVMLAGQGTSLLLLLVALLQTDTLSFIGLRQLMGGDQPARLITTGLYRAVRHPLYTFGLLILWLSPNMSVNSLMVYASLTVYILVGAYFEERKLLREFGQEYADYKSVTPMIVPRLLPGGNK